MKVEQWEKAESWVVKIGRSSNEPEGSFKQIHVTKSEATPVAKEPLCGTQPANLSLVIAVFCFPSFFVVPLFWLLNYKEVLLK
jgi:hypothetical protein